MKSKRINAKCPYCKTEFNPYGFSILWGEYAADFVTQKCDKCGKDCSISLTQTYEYKAKKIR